VQETAEQYDLATSLEPSMRALQEKLTQDGNFIQSFFEKMPEVSRVTNASGAAFIDRDTIYCNGATPDKPAIAELHKWLLQTGRQEFHTNKLPSVFPPAKGWEQVATGVLFFKIIHSDINISLLFFRPSQDKVIRWGGQPTAKTGIEALTPRNSFATWQQLIQGESLPWQAPEVDAGFRFVHALQQHLFRLFLREEESRTRQLNENLLKANKELENINWISTHDLKEPLRKISMFASMLETAKTLDTPQARMPIGRIKNSVGRMQRLMDDLLLYSQMSQGADSFEMIDLNELLAEVEKSFEVESADRVYELRTKELPVVYGNRFQLHQLFVNLLGNAIKFRKPGELQVVTISGDEKNKNNITFCDSGIGFSPELSEKIFRVFQRGHNIESIGGTGIGLAICKKIMENHSGTIAAESRGEDGACFHLNFGHGPVGN
jgi:chemotaxis family two-component system sensor kinase Cph1